MPCRSSLASMSFLPRDNCERSRRPSGAKGGGDVFGGETIGAAAFGFGAIACFVTAAVSDAGAAASAFATRGFLRSGLTCLATLSHSARSSSLSARRRRGVTDNSGIGAGRFIVGCDSGGRDDGAVLRGLVRYGAALPATALVLLPPTLLRPGRQALRLEPGFWHCLGL